MKALDEIPKQNDFRFIGITREGKEIACEVFKVNNIHTVTSEDDGKFVFHLLKGWRERTESDT